MLKRKERENDNNCGKGEAKREKIDKTTATNELNETRNKFSDDIEDCFMEFAKVIYAREPQFNHIVEKINEINATQGHPRFINSFTELCAYNGWFRMMKWGAELRGYSWWWGKRTMEFAVGKASLDDIKWMISEGCPVTEEAIERCSYMKKFEILFFFCRAETAKSLSAPKKIE